MTTTVERSFKNYIDWSSQHIKRSEFGPRYDDIMTSVEDHFGFLIFVTFAFLIFLLEGLQALGGTPSF